MEITLEQVERLREKAAVSYGQAKAALEVQRRQSAGRPDLSGGAGVIPGRRTPTTPPRGRRPRPPRTCPPSGARRLPEEAPPGRSARLLRRLRVLLLDNELEIWHREQPITCHPHAAVDRHSDLFSSGSPLPLMLLGLFFGFRYQVTGPDLEDDALNGVMGSVADTAADVGTGDG